MTTLAIRRTGERRRASIVTANVLGRGWTAILRVPLLWKVLGANLVLVTGMLVAHSALPQTSPVVELGVLLVLSFLATSSLVWLALRPLSALEHTAGLVAGGDFAARATDSPLADRQMQRLTSTVNKLLDRVEADRARIHYLAGRGVHARDIEREAVARELRDSFAQTLAGIGMQMSSLRRVAADPALAQQLETAHAVVVELTEEIRSVAETLYPGTLAQFGLVNTIEALARRVARRSGMSVRVEPGPFPPGVSQQTVRALYRVTDEALRNAEQHGYARNVRIALACNDQVTLDIEDDGRGIDMRAHDPLQAGLGLFSANAVLALLGGELQISSGPGLGTRVTARLPLDGPTGHRETSNGNAQ